MRTHLPLWGLCLLAATHAVHAAEGGGSIYQHGTENYMVGAIPPPGLYGMVYGNHYRTDRMNSPTGENLQLPGFKVRASAVVPRLVWVSGVQVLGGQLVAHALAPLADIEVSVGGMRQRKSGLGDITVGAGLGYHHSPQLHSAVAVDVILPTGSYTQGDLANLGRNYRAIEPIYALSYVDPQGFNGDVRLGYLFNQRNKATDYTSGQELHFDYAAGWGVGNGWTVGVGGYYRKQTRLDRQGGASLANSKSSGMAIGPSIKYDSGKGWFITAKWQSEQRMKNGTQGSAFWLKAVMPL
ncbi:SphA family protein [Simplicispira metamorpha]|uniref:Outer membrane beta-barrel porin/alpha-amylase n=1 Tax=Simplicispira metamorpha TaxID=80881 RepID=A0A4R2NGJ8_9BURK|nr:transporter [Simplicispira metamorpha]TCP20431.1 hypothetical protein EV674_10180 [Simplicispira metamorpha]